MAQRPVRERRGRTRHWPTSRPRAPETRRWCFADQLGPHFLDDPRPAGAARRVPGGLPRAGGSTGRRRTWCCRRCGTGPPSWATRPSSCRWTPTAQALDQVREPLSVCAPTTWRAGTSCSPAPASRCSPPAASSPRRPTSAAGPTGRGTDGGSGCSWTTSTATPGAGTTSSWTAATRSAGSGTSTTTTASPRRRTVGRRRPSRGGRRRTRSTRRCGPTWTAGRRDGDVSFVGDDGPRLFPVTRRGGAAPAAGLPGPPAGRLRSARGRDAAPTSRWLAHSLLSAAAEPGPARPGRGRAPAEQPTGTPCREHGLPLNSVEGFVRQVMGWRDYIWHLYWHLGRDYRHGNDLGAHAAVPGLAGRARRRRRSTPPACPACWATCAPRRLGAPHPAADGAGQLRPAARHRARWR